VKVAVVADAHLFQTFAESYDSVGDLGRALDEIKTKVSPDLLFLAGDMFDYMKTETIYLRHYEGEGYMVRVRDIFRDFGKPIYAIRGNHDKEEILRGLEQTVDNFHYETGAKNFGDFSACFMSSFYETGGYDDATLEKIEDFLKHSVTEMKGWGNKRVLLCHETFAPYDSAVPESVIDVMKRNFDVVLDGHMHFWNPSAYKSSRIVCLPSLLPSKIAKGKYASEKYTWSKGEQRFEMARQGAPFGYVTLDTVTLSAEFHEFTPSKRIIEVVLDVTDLQLEDARNRLRTMFSELDKRANKSELIILPVLVGEVAFSRLFLESVREEFPSLFIESIRDDAKPKAALTGGLVSAPTLSVDQLQEKILQDVPSLVEELREKGVRVDQGTLRTIVGQLLTEEVLARSQSIPQTASKLRSILGPVIEATEKSSPITKPSTFEDNLVSLLKRVR
jgi:predicted phosphodiesterase